MYELPWDSVEWNMFQLVNITVCSICSGTSYVSDFSWNGIPVFSIWLSLTPTQNTNSLSEGEIVKGFDERKISQCMVVNKKDLFKNLGIGSVHSWNPTNADVWKGKGVSSTDSGQMTHGFIKTCFTVLYIKSTQYSSVHVLYSFTVKLHTSTPTKHKYLVKFRRVVCFRRRTTTFSTRTVTAPGPDGGWPFLWIQESVQDYQNLCRAPTAVGAHSVLDRLEG